MPHFVRQCLSGEKKFFAFIASWLSFKIYLSIYLFYYQGAWLSCSKTQCSQLEEGPTTFLVQSLSLCFIYTVDALKEAVLPPASEIQYFHFKESSFSSFGGRGKGSSGKRQKLLLRLQKEK